ncbi:sel1 repeat family protein, partial [Candidatus Nomurabacteria bacterium]|nr:sel1 repeat family protein [Candidatus Nomurabacteria bacterium]
LYDNGYGVKQNTSEALKWFKKSAENGYSTAQYNLGIMYEYGEKVEVDYLEAIRLYSNAAKQNNADAMSAIGSMYLYGKGVAKNESEALKWFMKADDNGSNTAPFEICKMYMYGIGLTKDEKTAIMWLSKAVERNNSDAQAMLGRRLYNENKFDEAIRLFNLAANDDNVDGLYYLGITYMQGKGIDKDLNKAEVLIRRAAELGSQQAKELLKKVDTSR